MNKKFIQDWWSVLGKKFQKRLIILVFFAIFIEAAKMLSPYLFKLILDNLSNSKVQNIQYLLILVALMFLAGSFVNLIRYFSGIRANLFLADFEFDLALRVQKKLMSLPIDYHEREDTGSKVTKIQRGIDKATHLILMAIWEIFPPIIQIILTVIILFIVDPSIGFIFIVTAPVFFFISLKMNKKAKPLRDSLNDEYEKASGILGQSILNIFTVQSFSQEQKEYSKFKKVRLSLLQHSRYLWIILYARYSAYKDIFTDIGRLCIILTAIYLITHDSITIGTLVFALTLTERVYSSMHHFSHVFDRFSEASTTVQRLIDVLNQKSTIQNKDNAIIPTNFNGEIIFDNVKFLYKDRTQSVLNNISFTIPAGKKVALVGPSGGGKSTIIKLIYRHYDVVSGILKVDDIDIRDYDIFAYRKNISIVPQDVEIFNGTIFDNIAYGVDESSMKEIEQVAKIAHVDEFVKDFPKGYLTEVGERGIKLSGGQRQRVGIARAILSNPKILIFDEATSNLDSHSESLIQDALSKISKNRTMIIVAHRLSTIRECDKIIVVEGGRVLEEGTHNDLKANKGMYAHLVDLQNGGKL